MVDDHGHGERGDYGSKGIIVFGMRMISLKTPAERCDTVGVAFHASDLLLLVMLGFVEVIVDTDALHSLRLGISNFMEWLVLELPTWSFIDCICSSVVFSISMQAYARPVPLKYLR